MQYQSHRADPPCSLSHRTECALRTTLAAGLFDRVLAPHAHPPHAPTQRIRPTASHTHPLVRCVCACNLCVWAVPGRSTVQKSTWDHPCDNYFRDLYEEEKKKRGGSARGKQATGEARKAKERAQAKERSSIKAIIGKKVRRCGAGCVAGRWCGAPVC